MFTTRFYTVAASVTVLVLAVAGSAHWGYNKGFRKAEIEGAVEMANLKADKEQALKELQEATSQTTERVVVEYVDRIQETVKNKVIYRDVIKEVLVPSECNLSAGWVDVHDAAALNSDINIDSNANEQSNFTDIEGLSTVVENYAVCHKNTDQLLALQDWVQENYSQINRDVE